MGHGHDRRQRDTEAATLEQPMRRLAILAAFVPCIIFAQPATVVVETLEVRARAIPGAPVVATLKKGEAVIVDLVMTGTTATCSLTVTASGITGYAACNGLDRKTTANEFRPQDPIDAAIDRLLDAAGTEAMLRYATDPRQAEEELRRSGIPAGEAAEVLEIARRIATPEAMRSAFREALRRRYTPELIRGAIDWLDSPLGRRVTAVELAGLRSGMSEGFLAFARTVERTQFPVSRAKLVLRLDSVLEASGMTAESMVPVVREMLALVSQRLPPEKRPTPANVEQAIAGARSAEPELRKIVRAYVLYIYRDLSDAEFEDMVRFYESPPGRYLARAATEGSLDARRKMILDMSAALIDKMATRPRK